MTPEQVRLVVGNLCLVRAIVRSRYCGFARTGMFEFEDMVQIGCIGLIQAAKRYDPARGFPFKSLASVCIKHMICKAITAQNRERRCGRLLTLSLDGPARSGGDTPLGEMIAAPCVTEVDAMRRIAIERARDEIGAEWSLISLRCEADLNYQEIGEVLGVSRETARKRVNEAMARARELLQQAW